MLACKAFATMVVGVFLAGCYQPRAGDCEYLCGAGNSCPSGLTCDNNICRDPAEVGMSCGAADVDAQLVAA